MRLFEGYGDPENHPGRWFPLERHLREGEVYDPDAPECNGAAALKVRPIPEEVDERISRKWLGPKFKTIIKGAQGVSSIDRRKTSALRYERACWALIDCRNAEIQAGDERFAEMLSQETGAPVKIGQLVSLDGRLTDRLKHALFDRSAKLLRRVLEEAEALELEIEEEEEGKDEI